MNNASLIRSVVPMILLLNALVASDPARAASQPSTWTHQQTISDYPLDMYPPYLVADQNRTVHAFSSQWLGEGDGQAVMAIVYSQWTLEYGWTPPVDIALSPVKEARILGAFLDNAGEMHVVFYGGDSTMGEIYYMQAPGVYAAQVASWSTPILVAQLAADPSVGSIIGDDAGNLVIVYSGQQEGTGLYTLYSTDGGETWTDPAAIFLTYSNLFPFTLKLDRGESGLIHAVWDVRDRGGNGRQIDYARLNLKDQVWSEVVTIAEASSGYGVLNPTVVEHDGEVFLAYSGITMRRSLDGGQTWTEPAAPFRQVGVNGGMSFVVDSADILHFTWAQRITAAPDIHGVWHSIWLGERWSVPEAIVSGPRVSDATGTTSFDPYEVRAVVSQGNVLLAAWRTDPGPDNKPNGIWYSYKILDTLELPLTALPTPTAVIEVVPSTNITGSVEVPAITDHLPDERREDTGTAGAPSGGITFPNNPAVPLVIGLFPVVLLVGVLVIARVYRR